jgi:hypothetical protein
MQMPISSEEMQMSIEVGKLVSYQRAQLTKQGKKLSASGSRDISGRESNNGDSKQNHAVRKEGWPISDGGKKKMG